MKLCGCLKADDIIIKQADKDSAVVVLEKCDYIQEAERHHFDERCFKKLNSYHTPQYKYEFTSN